MRVIGWVARVVLCAAVGLSAVRAHAQIDDEVPPGANASDADASEADAPEPESPYEPWFFGGYFRHIWLPTYMTQVWFDRAPSISNNGFGLLLTHRSESGFSLVIGGGYTPYDIQGPFLSAGNPEEDTEIVTSDLKLWHVTASVLWSVIFHEMLALEIGLGLDVGVLSGDMNRNEAFFTPGGGYQPCAGEHMPAITAPSGTLYCNTDDPGFGATATVTDEPAVQGEHYNVREDRVPPVFGGLNLPQLALRFAPHRYVAVKAEFAFGIVQMWAGASLQIGFGLFTAAKKAEPEPEPPPVGPTLGRVLGRVLEKETKVPIVGATVTLVGRGRNPLSTVDDGRFVFGEVPPGVVRFDIQHADYAPGTCEVQVPDAGGDAAVYCYLEQAVRGGAISGQVQDQTGRGIGSARVLIIGPKGMQISADGEGLFAALDLPPGNYQLQVDAAGHLMQVMSVEVAANETATPTIVLMPRPKQQLVEVSENEIVIRQQILFGTGSADIAHSSEPLMRQIADVFLRNPNIERVEIQGHTDSIGKREFNMQLSQDRADAVREWLIGAGVAPSRMVARGYGPDHALRPNNNAANRAANRRVQFIIKEKQQP